MYMCVCICGYVFGCGRHVSMYMYDNLSISVDMYICVYIDIYICICVHMCICVC